MENDAAELNSYFLRNPQYTTRDAMKRGAPNVFTNLFGAKNGNQEQLSANNLNKLNRNNSEWNLHGN